MEKRQFTIVSEWMGGGNIEEFIEDNHVNRLELVREPTLSSISCAKIRWQLRGPAQGLKYLHSINLPHGDLKGVSVFPFRD